MEMRPMRSSGKKKGMTLLEMLAYIAVLSVVFGLGTKTVISAMRLSAWGQGIIAAQADLDALRRDFADAVHLSAGVAVDAGPCQATAARLVLQMPPDEAGQPCYAVFGLLEDGRFYRQMLVQLDAGQFESGGIRTYAARFSQARFAWNACMAHADLVPRTMSGERPPAPHTLCAAFRRIGGQP